MSIQMCIQGSFVNAVFLTLIFSMFRTLFFISKGMVRYFFFFKNKSEKINPDPGDFGIFWISHSKFSRDFKIKILIPGISRSGFFFGIFGIRDPEKIPSRSQFFYRDINKIMLFKFLYAEFPAEHFGILYTVSLVPGAAINYLSEFFYILIYLIIYYNLLVDPLFKLILNGSDDIADANFVTISIAFAIMCGVSERFEQNIIKIILFFTPTLSEGLRESPFVRVNF